MAWYDDIGNYLQPLTSGKLDPVLALGSSGLGAVGLISNIVEANRQKKMQQEALALARSPVNWQQFYQPMSEQYSRQRRNALMAELATRGIPVDSMYASKLIADDAAAAEREMTEKAMQLGIQARNTQLQGYGTAGNLTPKSDIFKNAAGILEPFMALRKTSALQKQRQALEQPPSQAMQFTEDIGIPGSSRYSSLPSQFYAGSQFEQEPEDLSIPGAY